MPGLHLFRSNRIEVLSTLLAGDVTDKLPGNPFAPITIMVGSRGMERWLRHQLAEKLSVCANFAFPFPAVAIDAIVAVALGQERDPDAPDPWSVDALTWALLEVLPKHVQKPSFEIVHNYLEDPAAWNGPVDAKQYGLARRIADVFDRYVEYRPDLARAWSTGGAALPSGAESLGWQPVLWQGLTGHLGQSAHRATRIEQAEKRLRAEKALPALVSPLFIFGVSSLPPSWMSLLGALSKHIDVDLFLLCPSNRYWADMRKNAGFSAAHPLLLSMGTVARDFQRVLESQPDHYVDDGADAFPDPADRRPCALTWLQSDLLAARHPTEAPDGSSRKIAADDDSVQLHSCYGPTRQIEVLRDLILGMLEDHPSVLEPRDILVMTPDIAKYAPLITAVFSQGLEHRTMKNGQPIRGPEGWGPAGAPAVPFDIADLSVRRLNPVADALLRVLQMVDDRLEASFVVDLLTLEPVRLRFDLEPDDIPTLVDWIEQSGIRWARDADHRAREGQPADPQNTWRFGLRRLLLGAVMADDGGRLVSGDDAPGRTTDVRPFGDMEGSDTPLLGKLVDFCNTLFSLIDALREPRSLLAWVEALNDVVDRMTATTESSSWLTVRVRETLEELARSARGAASSRAIGIDALRRTVEGRFDVASRATREQSGAVTFCAMRPMRSVPYEVVCLLGMDEGTFPRQKARLAFDLVSIEPAVGDTDPRDEDRYLILEAILAARRKLVVLYSGRDPRTNEKKPPCVPIGELKDLVDQSFVVPATTKSAGAWMTAEHPLLAVSPRNFLPEHRTASGELLALSFDRRLLSAARARREKLPPPAFFAMPVQRAEADEPTEVTLDELERFFKHPIEHFVQRQLKIRLSDEGGSVPDREPIELDGLERWKLRNALLEEYGEQRGPDQVLRDMRAEGTLPLGYSGKAEVSLHASIVEEMLETLPFVRDASHPVPIDVAVGETRVVGSLTSAHGALLTYAGFGDVAARRLIGPWISLVAWHAAGRNDARAIIVLGDLKDGRPAAKLVGFDVPHDARGVLAELVSIYRRGTRCPIPLLPKASWDFAKSIKTAASDPSFFASGLPTDEDAETAVGKALTAAQKAWDGEYGDSTDPYLARVYEANSPIVDETGALSLDFARLALTVWGPAVRAYRTANQVKPWIGGGKP
jgi:exodeoxyribonuclease V gamma subunit